MISESSIENESVHKPQDNLSGRKNPYTNLLQVQQEKHRQSNQIVMIDMHGKNTSIFNSKAGSIDVVTPHLQEEEDDHHPNVFATHAV